MKIFRSIYCLQTRLNHPLIKSARSIFARLLFYFNTVSIAIYLISIGPYYYINKKYIEYKFKHSITYQVDSAKSAIRKNINAFEYDALNGKVDRVHHNIYENTVYILSITPGKQDKKGKFVYIVTGSGVIISNSSSSRFKHNLIMTANHVVNGDQVGHEIINQPETICSHNNQCYAIDSYGNLLGTLKVAYMYHGDKKSRYDIMDYDKHDLALFSISPFSKRYDELKGVPLANELSESSFNVLTSKKYHTHSGKSYEIGVSSGFSGGGAFNTKGELIGIVSAGWTATSLPKAIILSMLFKKLIYSDANIHINLMGAIRTNNMEDSGYKTYLKNAGIQFNTIPLSLLEIENLEGSNCDGVMDSGSHTHITSIYSNDMFKLLGSAGLHKNPINIYSDDNVILAGYPNSIPISFDSKIEPDGNDSPPPPIMHDGQTN